MRRVAGLAAFVLLALALGRAWGPAIAGGVQPSRDLGANLEQQLVRTDAAAAALLGPAVHGWR